MYELPITEVVDLSAVAARSVDFTLVHGPPSYESCSQIAQLVHTVTKLFFNVFQNETVFRFQ